MVDQVYLVFAHADSSAPSSAQRQSVARELATMLGQLYRRFFPAAVMTRIAGNKRSFALRPRFATATHSTLRPRRSRARTACPEQPRCGRIPLVPQWHCGLIPDTHSSAVLRRILSPIRQTTRSDIGTMLSSMTLRRPGAISW